LAKSDPRPTLRRTQSRHCASVPSAAFLGMTYNIFRLFPNAAIFIDIYLRSTISKLHVPASFNVVFELIVLFSINHAIMKMNYRTKTANIKIVDEPISMHIVRIDFGNY
jgi:hypothetical protein